mmetsp:Transcript_12754/g.15406  ORF Transcript_12754/g.15406 Transcript_12754/m.15406 type:complete len:199 (-) Transcript_12754:246-842(-)|eukprot:CAMPEP_0197865096 /NCGR_PEP_ID=MMETSP1438-20131217/43466_1 /TAXON_ID=1461541 /ORGANISM="Pterosperma sp., Strain CCMP1384" /LENGTH=198 /DNA_ID=CAMNT_0043483507 /DNA_START=62 /DNA_END=658 /DNA_ORIENTATION=+
MASSMFSSTLVAGQRLTPAEQTRSSRVQSALRPRCKVVSAASKESSNTTTQRRSLLHGILTTTALSTLLARVQPAQAVFGAPDNTKRLVFGKKAAYDPDDYQSVIVGEYNDPSHPGCRREIDDEGNVYGADPVPIQPGAPCLPGEETTPWQLQGKFKPGGTSIMIDFDPIDEVKQGPVLGKWTGEGLQLPNGLWTKKK